MEGPSRSARPHPPTRAPEVTERGGRRRRRQVRRLLEVPVGGLTVVAVLHLPEDDPPSSGWPLVVTCHGVNGSKIGPSRGFVDLAQRLAERRIATVRLDYRGAGDSEGSSAILSPSTAVEDIEAVVSEVVGSAPVDPTALGLVGHSFGGVVACGALGRLPGVGAVSLWSSPLLLDPGSFPGLSRLTGLEEGAGFDWDGYELGGRFLEEMAAARPLDDLRRASVSVLLVHGADDDTVPVEQSTEAAAELRAAGREVELEVIAPADHSFATRSSLGRAVRVTVGWLARWLGP